MATIAEGVFKGDVMKRVDDNMERKKKAEHCLKHAGELIDSNPTIRDAIVRNAESISKNLSTDQVNRFVRGKE